MQKFTDHCTAVLRRVIVIGFSVQIVLGAIWMCNAFAGLDGFGEGIVCAGKIALFLCAVFYFLGTVPGVRRGAALFGSLSIAMFPMVLQCHFTVGIQSVSVSLLLAEAGGILRAMRTPQRKKRLLIWLPAVAVTVCMMAGTGGRNHRSGSVLECLSSRFAWTVLTDTYDCMPEEWQESVDRYKLRDSSFEAVGMEQILIPYLKATLGEEQTEKFLAEMIRVAWRQHRPQIAKEIFWDLAGYTLSPVVLQLQLKGRAYHSYSGVNYRQILFAAPEAGRVYMDYSCWWFLVSLLISGILWIVKFTRGFRIPDRRGCLLIFLACVCMAAIYTMSGAGKMDYKNTAFILCMWLTGILAAAIQDTGMPGGKQDEENNSILA